MVLSKFNQFWMRRVSFVGNMGCECACVGFQQPLTTHSCDVFNYLLSVQVVSSHLSAAVCMVKNYRIKVHLTMVKRLPSCLR